MPRNKKDCDFMCNSMDAKAKVKTDCKNHCTRKYTGKGPGTPEAYERYQKAHDEAVRQDDKRNKARDKGRKKDKNAQQKEEKSEQKRRKKAQQKAERDERAARRDREKAAKNDKRVGGIAVQNLDGRRQRGGHSNNAGYDARGGGGGRSRSSAVTGTAPGLIKKCKGCMSSRCYGQKTDNGKKECKKKACQSKCKGVSDADVGLNYITREYHKLRF